MLSKLADNCNRFFRGITAPGLEGAIEVADLDRIKYLLSIMDIVNKVGDEQHPFEHAVRNVKYKQVDGKSFQVFVTLLDHGADPTLTNIRYDTPGHIGWDTDTPAFVRYKFAWNYPIVLLTLFHPKSCRKVMEYFDAHEAEQKRYESILPDVRHYIQAIDTENFSAAATIVEVYRLRVQAKFRMLNQTSALSFTEPHHKPNHERTVNNYLGLSGYLETLAADYKKKLAPTGRPSNSSDEVPRSDASLKV